MAEYQKTIITNAGISLLNRVLAGKATATFTRAVSSTDDLFGKTEAELRNMTSFSNIMQNGICSRYDIHNQNMVSLDLVFTNEGLGNSYLINTVGLYAKASDSSSEVLYAIARAGKDSKGNSLAEQMPAYVDSKLTKFTISLFTQVGQSSSVDVSITDEGVVKSINGTIKPDANGNVTIDDSSHAKFIEAELIHGHLLVPLVDDSGSPITDPAGNQLIADEYLPKSIKLGNGQAIYPGADNMVRLPVYTQAEIDNRLEVKADLLQMEDEHKALQGQITDNTDYLGTVDKAIDQHAKQISQATGEASYALDQISTGQTLTALSDGQGGYLTDEHGNALLTPSARVNAIKLGGQTCVPDSTGNVSLDTYSKQEINNLVDSLKLAIDQVKLLIK